MLEVKGLSVYYGNIHALKDVSISVKENEIVSLIGANGAGKSTLLNAISRVVDMEDGKISFMGKDISHNDAEQVVKSGIIHCPEGRRIFEELTVYENILSGAYTRKDKDVKKDVEMLMERLPRLKERRKQLANTLSGGEQQMLAICRSLVAKPKILLLDEPSMGLSPVMVQEVFQIIREANEKDGITILLVEQNANLALKISDRAYVIESGEIVKEGASLELLQSDDVRKAYLGEG